jgi:hypothetical protein
VTTEFLVFAEPLLVKGSSTEFCFPNKAQHCISRQAGIYSWRRHFEAFLLHCSCTHVTRTPALGRRFLVKSQMPNMLWALECFFFRSNTGYYCVGWKRRGFAVLTTDKHPPSQAREPGFIQHLKGGGERKGGHRGFGVGIGIGMGEPTISARSTRKFVLVQREG